MRRIADFSKGLVALASILLLLVGVPAALVIFAGNPLDDIQRLLSDELLSDDTTASLALRAGLTVLAWLAWAQIAVSILVELLALARGRVAGRASLLPGVQDLARRLVVASTLLVNAFTSTTGATALMPLAVPAPVESVEVDLLRPPDLDGPDLVVAVDAPSATYTAVGGDTFWSLAESMLGDGLRWSEIREANLGRTMPDGTVISEATEVVRAGWELLMPPDADLPFVQEADAEIEREPTTTAPVVIDETLIPDQLELAGDGDASDPEMLGSWRVAPGDHFWAIAEETLTAAYGRPVTDEEITPYWQKIVDANRDRLSSADPDLVHPGETFDVLVPPLTDDVLLGVTTDGPTGADAPVADAADAATNGTGDGSAPAGHAAGTGHGGSGVEGSAPARPAWTALDDPASEGTLTPFEPANGGSTPIDGATVALGVFGTAVGAGALLERLRRRRRDDAGEHPTAGSGAAGPVGADRFEARIRPIANTDAVRWLAATNRYLTRQLSGLADDVPLPAVLAVRAGEFGIEVLLDEPSAPPEGFVADGATGAAWRLRADLDLEAVEAAGRGAQPYSPALLPVGETDAGDLLVDFEQLAVVSLVGDIGTIAGWLATIATSATAMSWSQTASVVAVGVQTVLGGSNQVRVPTDVDSWAAETIEVHTAATRSAHTSTYRRRLDAVDAAFGEREPEGPTIVLLGPGHDELARRLTAVAELAHSSLVLITTTALDGHPRVELRPDHGVVVPDESGLRLEFDPIVTGSATARYAAELVGPDDGLRQFADVFDTVRRRPLELADEHDDDVPHHLWPPPAIPSARLSAPPPAPEVEVEEPDTDGVAEVSPDRQPPPELQQELQPGIEAWPPPSLEPAASPATEGVARPQPGSAGDPSGGADSLSARLRVLQPRPIEARLLTAVPSMVGLDAASPGAEELLLFLAAFRTATPAELGRHVLPEVPSDGIEQHLADELVALDAAAGRAADGRHRVLYDESSGRYRVGDDVESDLHRFEALVELADRAHDPTDEQACLEAALGLVDSNPDHSAHDRFGWLANDHPARSSIDGSIVDAACRLGELAVADGRADTAMWAAQRGLAFVPGRESLHRIQMKAAASRDDRQGVEDAYRAAVEAMEQLAPWRDGLQPETDALYRKLVDPLTDRS